MIIDTRRVREGRTAALWSVQEFGSAKLGNKARTARLVAMGAQAVQSPGGLVNAVFSNEAEREGAYRFLENDKVRVSQITAAASRATLRRLVGEQIVVAPIDGSSLAYSDHDGRRQMGSIGARSKGGRGIKVLTTIGTTLDGIPLGILDQTFWRRSLVRNPVHHQNRPFRQRETRHLVDQMERITRRCVAEGTQSIVWFNGDCETDFKEALEFAVNAPDNIWVSVRNGRDRKIVDEVAPEGRMLWDAVEGLPRRGSYKVQVTAGENRSERVARMRVRAGHVTLLLRKRSNNNRDAKAPVRVGVVWAMETGTIPMGEEPLEWLILTTAPIETVDDVLRVIHAYALRWRVEDFHKAWKTGCKIEESQLGNINNIMRWAALMASVAIRIERIKHLGRNEPDAPAAKEFSAEEIEAASLLADPGTPLEQATVTMERMVTWIAKVGGYVAGRGRPPPGVKVLARGLLRVQDVAFALRAKKARRQT